MLIQKGIVLSGGPSSVNDQDSPIVDIAKYRGKIPILGLCYGAQLIAKQNGGSCIKFKDT